MSLLVERAADPYKSHWAFPGGFLNVGEEDLPACARRELEEETHLQVGTLVELGVFSRPTEIRAVPCGDRGLYVVCSDGTSSGR